MVNEQPATRRGKRYVFLPLVIPFIALLWIPFYAGTSPYLGGIPFFYWYQFAWVILGVLITGAVYYATR